MRYRHQDEPTGSKTLFFPLQHNLSTNAKSIVELVVIFPHIISKVQRDAQSNQTLNYSKEVISPFIL